MYLAQLQKGGIEIEKGASREEREALFLRSLIGIEKALEEGHEH